MSKKYVYLFHEGNKDMKDILGGKGANLAEMSRIGLPVPPGLTISTEACTDYFKDGNIISNAVLDEVWNSLKHIEEKTGKTFGDNTNPLLVSVRSGAS